MIIYSSVTTQAVYSIKAAGEKVKFCKNFQRFPESGGIKLYILTTAPGPPENSMTPAARSGGGGRV